MAQKKIDPVKNETKEVGKNNFETPSVDRNIKYTVKEGDKIHEIATRFNISVGELLDANDLTSLELTQEQVLLIK